MCVTSLKTLRVSRKGKILEKNFKIFFSFFFTIYTIFLLHIIYKIYEDKEYFIYFRQEIYNHKSFIAKYPNFKFPTGKK